MLVSPASFSGVASAPWHAAGGGGVGNVSDDCGHGIGRSCSAGYCPRAGADRCADRSAGRGAGRGSRIGGGESRRDSAFLRPPALSALDVPLLPPSPPPLEPPAPPSPSSPAGYSDKVTDAAAAAAAATGAAAASARAAATGAASSPHGAETTAESVGWLQAAPFADRGGGGGRGGRSGPSWLPPWDDNDLGSACTAAPTPQSSPFPVGHAAKHEKGSGSGGNGVADRDDGVTKPKPSPHATHSFFFGGGGDGASRADSSGWHAGSRTGKGGAYGAAVAAGTTAAAIAAAAVTTAASTARGDGGHRSTDGGDGDGVPMSEMAPPPPAQPTARDATSPRFQSVGAVLGSWLGASPADAAFYDLAGAAENIASLPGVAR
ncbi:unnamed protein product, partial [Phaeothamnion confervicola]